MARYLEVGQFARVICFDKWGAGLSDPVALARCRRWSTGWTTKRRKGCRTRAASCPRHAQNPAKLEDVRICVGRKYRLPGAGSR